MQNNDIDEDLIIKDNQKFQKHKLYKKVIQDHEKLFWSGNVCKTNRRGRKQKRLFILTTKRVINIESSNAFMSMFKKAVKRSIDLENIESITYSTISYNFLLHVPSEYDYTLYSENRDEFIEFLMLLQEKKGIQKIYFYLVEDENLNKYAKKEGQKRDRFPSCTPKEWSYEKFRKFVRKRNLKDQKEGSLNLISEKSFVFIRELSSNNNSKTFLAKWKDTNDYVAIKVISKLDVIRQNEVEIVKNENKIRKLVDNKFILNVLHSFSTPSNIYFVMKHREGGNLMTLIKERINLKENTIKFFLPQIIMGLLYLHEQNILVRNLKPEVILIDRNGYIVITNFQLSKVIDQDNKRGRTILGSPEFLAPEMIEQKKYDKAVDFWALGVLLYELSFGNSPFYDNTMDKAFERIKKVQYKFPKLQNKSDELKDLIKQVYQKAFII